MPDLHTRGAVQLATQIATGEVSSVEVVEAFLAQIAKHNQRINAVVTLDAEGALARAAQADAALARGERWGPLHGVPITVKDAFATAGMRTTAGYAPLRDYVPAEDATAVARLKGAGAVLLGKTNLPVLSGDYQSVNPIFGRTNNPWNLGHVPGGSSGGSAAAIAAQFSALELGSDYSGSIRVPAHYCGVYGLRPTEHRVPMTGHIPVLPGAVNSVRHVNTVGPLARSIDDIELALALIAGPDGRDWQVPPVPLGREATPEPGALKIAISVDFDVPLSVDTHAGFTWLAGELEQAGASVELIRLGDFGFSLPEAYETFGEIAQAELGAGLSPEEERAAVSAFRANRTDDDPMARGMANAIDASARFYIASLLRREALVAALHEAFEQRGWQALLTPVTVCPTIPHCDTGTPVAVDDCDVPYWPAGIAYSSPFSLAGVPVLVAPLTRSHDGLPIGMQVVGPRWGEARVLAVARALEQFTGGFAAPPGY